MKIRDSLDSKPVLRSEKSSKASRAAANKAKAGASDTVELSHAADEVRALQERGGADEVRTAKVEAIRQQMDQGHYHVPTEEIADALVDHVLRYRMRE